MRNPERTPTVCGAPVNADKGNKTIFNKYFDSCCCEGNEKTAVSLNPKQHQSIRRVETQHRQECVWGALVLSAAMSQLQLSFSHSGATSSPACYALTLKGSCVRIHWFCLLYLSRFNGNTFPSCTTATIITSSSKNRKTKRTR